MNPAFIPIACGSALALMVGATVTHWVSVRQTVTLVQSLPTVPHTKPSALAPPAEDPGTLEAKTLLASVRSAPSAVAGAAGRTVPAGDAPPSAVDARFQQVLAALENMVEINQELRNQVAETNRDLMELQFQVDTHSQSFRPLNATDESPMILEEGLGVLPPSQGWSE